MYKVVTKIVVGRIRPLLNKLVSPVQAAFVPGRRGLDNIIIAQEQIHSIDNKRGKEGYMAIKVDLEKAYDRLEWNFIHKVLQAYHFPSKLIQGRSQDLKLRGAGLLLAMCNSSGFQLYCLTNC